MIPKNRIVSDQKWKSFASDAPHRLRMHCCSAKSPGSRLIETICVNIKLILETIKQTE